jgi:hypothetical protein
MGMEMLYLLALGAGGPVAAKVLHFCAGVLSLAGVFCCARRLAGSRAGLLAVSLLLVPSPLVELSWLISFAYNDLGVLWMVVAGLIFWLASRSANQSRLRAAAALCGGFAASFKLTALVWCLAFPLVFWLEDAQAGRDLRGSLRSALRTCLVGALPVVPWFLRSWRLTGNPVYPAFSGVLPSRDWNGELARAFGLFFRYYNWGKRFGTSWSPDARALLLTAASILVLGGCALAITRTRQREVRSLLVMAALSIGLSLSVTGLYFRFWLPALTCLLLAALWWLSKRAPRERFWAPSAALLLALGIVLRFRGEGPEFHRELRIAFGSQTLDEAYRDDPLWDTWRLINTQTPPGAHVLIAAFYPTFGASSGGAFWVDRPVYVTDSALQGYIHLEDWPSFVRSITDARIRYVLIADKLPNQGRLGFSFPASTNEYPFCKRMVEEFGERVGSYGHLQVYRLRFLDF